MLNCNRYGTHIKFMKLWHNASRGCTLVETVIVLQRIFACVSVSATAKAISYFDKLWQKACYDFAHSSKEWRDNLKELKHFVDVRVVSVFLHEANDVGLYIWCLCWGYKFSYRWRPLVDMATRQIGYAKRQRVYEYVIRT